MTQTADIQRLAGDIGELKGQMRELIHTSNNNSMKLEALSEKVITSASIPDKIVVIEARLSMLEVEKNKRDGATGIISAIMKSPALGWLVGAAITAWAILTGKVHI